MKNKSIFLIIYSIILIGRTSFSQDTSSVTTFRVDPTNAIAGTAFQLFDEVNYIPLETIPESIFGAIKRLYITDEYFIIYDSDTQSILFFYKNGKFHCKIKNGFEILSPTISIDKKKNQVMFYNSKRLLFCYDFNGNKISQTSDTKYLTADYIFPNDMTAHARYYASESFKKDSVANHVSLSKNGKVSAAFFPYNVKTSIVQTLGDILFEPNFLLLFPTGNDTSMYFVRMYDYSIYMLTPSNLYKKYSFIFPLKNSLPNDFYTDTLLKGKRSEYIKVHNDLIYGITNPYKIGNNLFMRFDQWNVFDSYMYNTVSDKLVSLRNVEPDKLTFGLPLTDLGAGDEFGNMNFLSADSRYIYSSLSSAMMFRFNDVAMEKKVKYGSVLNNYFKKGNRKDNPVIVQIRPKDNY